MAWCTTACLGPGVQQWAWGLVYNSGPGAWCTTVGLGPGVQQWDWGLVYNSETGTWCTTAGLGPGVQQWDWGLVYSGEHPLGRLIKTWWLFTKGLQVLTYCSKCMYVCMYVCTVDAKLKFPVHIHSTLCSTLHRVIMEDTLEPCHLINKSNSFSTGSC